VLKSFSAALALFAIACSSLAATPAKSKKKRHPPAATSAAPSKHSTTAAKASAVKTSSTTPRRKGKIVRAPSRSFQQAPTPDRYKEIQQALVSKGYLQGEPTGQWGPDSADALKRFQANQNLMPDGKINSLSLIALGLGPKRLTAKSEAAPLPPAAPSATAPPAPAVPGPPQ
jgi:peptidoglycan hydrolase-like protein with peptidoglycan-binding domain